MTQPASIAYFSMEIALATAMPTYAGGLGVLAGDTVRSAADLGVPMIAISLLTRKGYFHQQIDETGWQSEKPVAWSVDDYLKEMPARAVVQIEGRQVTLRCWEYKVKGISGHVVPVYFLDTDIEGNAEDDRTLTHYLYGGDVRYRLCQEVILGIGGIRMLRALGYPELRKYHMNEGHAGLLILELLLERARATTDSLVTQKHIDAVKPDCVFTTHTPVPSGHDQFQLELVHRVLGPAGPFAEREREFCCDGVLNLTYLALDNSGYVNGVAKTHGAVSRDMFAGYPIDSITNGIHLATWASESMRQLFDQYIAGWRADNASLRHAVSIPKAQVWDAHENARRQLIDYVNRTANAGMDVDVLTLAFARRATAYKRPDLLFRDIERLREVSERAGPIQIVYAGKAHPRDHHGKELIQHIHRMRDVLKHKVNIAYLPGYDMALAGLIVAGADIWLNTPQPPLEASGTSGMKAAINGVPSLSVLDGWWVEGCIEGVTGWSIGERGGSTENRADDESDASLLYDKLEHVILPMYYRDRDKFIEIMRNAIAINGSFFNTERMLREYVTKAYFK
jgi:starch phosphorylase